MAETLVDKIRQQQRSNCFAVASTLSWAASRNVPFAQAVRKLDPKSWNPIFVIAANPFLALITGGMILLFLSFITQSRFPLYLIPFVILITPAFTAQRRYQAALKRLADSLEKGLSLGDSLKMHMRHILPNYYIQAVVKAEEDENLEQQLPLLAVNLASGVDVPQLKRIRFLTFLYVVLFLTLIIYSGFLTFVAPKFSKMFNEMLGDNYSNLLFYRLTDYQDLIFILQGIVGLVLFTLAPLIYMFSNANPFYNALFVYSDRFYNLCERIYLCVPFIRRWVVLRRRIEFAQYMSLALHTNTDISALGIRDGRVFWPGGPHEGFSLCIEIWGQSLIRAEKFLTRFFTVLLYVLAIGAVFTIVYSIFEAFVALIGHMTDL